MARGRWLKPEFFTDRKMAELDPITALVYQALWCWADDTGVCMCDPAVLKAQVFFRWSAVGVPEISEALRHLSGMGRVRFLRGGDDWFAEVLRWKNNQPIHKPSKFSYRIDYSKRGKPLQETVPEWLGDSAALCREQCADPHLLNTPTPQHPDSQNTGPNGPAAGAARQEISGTWHGLAAPALRNAGVSEPDIGDALKNWWPVAVKLTTSHAELAAFVLWAGKQKVKKGLSWNPAARWNVRNEDGVRAFKWNLGQFRQSGQGGATAKRRVEHGQPQRVSPMDFGT